MRGLVAICLGLVMMLGAGAAGAGINPGEEDCGVCECVDDGTRPICVQGDDPGSSPCIEACSGANPMLFTFPGKCTQVPGCPQFGSTNSAPIASPYGIAALLIALGGFGAWRLSKRAAA